MILTFKIALTDWHAVLEVDSSTTLDELHLAIQEAVQFDDDHMYEFFIARTKRSQDKKHFDMEDGDLDTTRIADLLPLPKDRKLFYLFDYGDSWTFTVSRTRRPPFEPEKGVQYPRLIKEVGDRPEQYPDYDE
ncbi:plasmid pRiA4b ORF-3 family protein [Granulosicoccus sp.]|nr:plasmid pRiA4b ORF-3 family protein [Granulosicoccus sp.]